MEETEWISWEAAADLTGLPVPTIEHAVRVGRIRRRPQRGRVPTLDATSAQQWASWYRDLQEHRTTTGRGGRLPPVPLPPGEWLSTAEAAAVLEVGIATTRAMKDAGQLEAHRSGKQLWFSATQVRALAAERAQWITWNAAADMLGCPRSLIPKLIEEGHLEQRTAPTFWPSLRRSTVVAYVEPYKQDLATAARHRETVEQARRERTAGPQDGGVWLDLATAALVLDLTTSGVLVRIHGGRLPATKLGRRWWMRRGDVERAAAADVFLARTDTRSDGVRASSE